MSDTDPLDGGVTCEECGEFVLQFDVNIPADEDGPERDVPASVECNCGAVYCDGDRVR